MTDSMSLLHVYSSFTVIVYFIIINESLFSTSNDYFIVNIEEELDDESSRMCFMRDVTIGDWQFCKF